MRLSSGSIGRSDQARRVMEAAFAEEKIPPTALAGRSELDSSDRVCGRGSSVRGVKSRFFKISCASD